MPTPSLQVPEVPSSLQQPLRPVAWVSRKELRLVTLTAPVPLPTQEAAVVTTLTADVVVRQASVSSNANRRGRRTRVIGSPPSSRVRSSRLSAAAAPTERNLHVQAPGSTSGGLDRMRPLPSGSSKVEYRPHSSSTG